MFPNKKFDKKKRMSRKKLAPKKRHCRYCAEKELRIDYKDVRLLSHYVTERGRLVPRRITGNCAQHQKIVALAVKRARVMALIPFTATQVVAR